MLMPFSPLVFVTYATKKLSNVVEQFSRDVYAYFANSTKRRNELAECEVFAYKNPQKMLSVSQTRWLPFKAVVDRILEHRMSLTLFFQRAALKDNLPSAKCILNALKNPLYKLYLFFLSYVLELITKVNKEMQSESSKFPILLSRTTTLYEIIFRNLIKPDIINKFTLHLNNVNKPHYVLN